MSGKQNKKLNPPWYAFNYIFVNGIRDSLNNVKSYAKGHLLDGGCDGNPYQALFISTITGHIGKGKPTKQAGTREMRQVDVCGGDLPGLPFGEVCYETILCK